MTCDEMLDQAIEVLQQRGRVSYRALKAQFQLDDDLPEILKQDGNMVIWTGNTLIQLNHDRRSHVQRVAWQAYARRAPQFC